MPAAFLSLSWECLLISRNQPSCRHRSVPARLLCPALLSHPGNGGPSKTRRQQTSWMSPALGPCGTGGCQPDPSVAPSPMQPPWSTARPLDQYVPRATSPGRALAKVAGTGCSVRGQSLPGEVRAGFPLSQKHGKRMGPFPDPGARFTRAVDPILWVDALCFGLCAPDPPGTPSLSEVGCDSPALPWPS